MHKSVLGLARRSPSENALASPLVSPSVVKRRFDRRPGRRIETAVLVQKALAYFCDYDRWPPTAVRNRRLDLVDLNILVSNGGCDRWL